jgi:hypothetical protein
MKPSVLLRTASVISLLLCAGHSAGALSSWSPVGNTPVLESMRSFQFNVTGFNRSYWHFYMGFGIVISVYFLVQTIILWQLASLATTDPRRARPMVLVFFAALVAVSIINGLFFFAIPLVMSSAIAVCLGLALMPRKERPTPAAA